MFIVIHPATYRSGGFLIHGVLNTTSPLGIINGNISHDASYEEEILQFVHDDVQEDYTI